MKVRNPISFSGFFTGLSDDSKTLFCYYTWSFSDNNNYRTVNIDIKNLIYNESRYEGKVYKDDFIAGRWSINFDLINDKNNSLTIVNNDTSK